jgi:hypothetical protein
MSDLERRLEDLFMHDSRSRQVTNVGVPTRRASPLRGVAFVGATALAVLALVIALNTLRGPQVATPVVSPSTSATASVTPAATATGSPNATSSSAASVGRGGPETPGVRPDASHGMLTRNPAAIRTEADPTALNKTPNWNEGAAAAVSPDGKRVAILRTGETGQGIITFTTEKPDEITSVMDMAGTGENLVGAPVWAADNSDSLLLAITKPGAATGVAPPPAYSALRSVDVKTHKVTEVTRTTNGFVLVPVVWHPGAAAAAAYETGDGGFAVNYLVIRGQQVTRTPFGATVVGGTLAANQDGTRVAAIYGTPGATVHWWPFDRFDQQTELKPAVGDGAYRAYWRAGRDEIVVATGPSAGIASANMRVEVWGSQAGRRVVRDTGGIALVRVDGTAALAFDYQLVDLTTGATTPVQKRATSETAYLAVLF